MAGFFPGQAMRASTLKGLIIHTRRRPGPRGAGLPVWLGPDEHGSRRETLFCATASRQVLHAIVESRLASGADTADTAFVWDGASPIRVTLCWTDPAAAGVTTLNSRTPCLVNDLDLRVIGPDGAPVYFALCSRCIEPNRCRNQ